MKSFMKRRGEKRLFILENKSPPPKTTTRNKGRMSSTTYLRIVKKEWSLVRLNGLHNL